MVMKKNYILLAAVIIAVLALAGYHYFSNGSASPVVHQALPEVKETPLLKLLKARRSVRKFTQQPISFATLASTLFAAHGVTSDKDGLRTAPSAGKLHPTILYVIAYRVTGLATGVYQYVPASNTLIKVSNAPSVSKLNKMIYRQQWVADAAAILILTADTMQTAKKFGNDNALKYVAIEIGAIAQNIYLSAAAEKLGTTFVGNINSIKMMHKLSLEESPFGIMPLGVPVAKEKTKTKPNKK